MLYARHESQRLGSDRTCIAKDLKTLRGIANRILRGVWPDGTWQVYYSACDRSFLAAQQDRHIGTVHKFPHYSGFRSTR